MRGLLLLCWLLLSVIAIPQTVSVFKKNKKVGAEIPYNGGDVRKNVESKVVLKANYDDYRRVEGGFVFYKKKSKLKVDAVLVLQHGGQTKDLGTILMINNHFIRYEINGFEHLYEIKKRQDRFTNKETIIVKSTRKNGKTIWYYMINHENRFSLYINNERTFETSGKYLSSDVHSEFILLDNGKLIDFGGQLILDNVSHVKRHTPKILKSKSRLFVIHMKDGKQGMINLTQVIIPPSKNTFIDFCVNENRIILKSEEGYFVYDAQGNKLNASAYNDILPFKRKSEDNNAAKIDDHWCIINENFEVVKQLPYESLEEIEGDYYLDYRFYKVKTKVGDKMFFVLDESGEKVFQEAVVSVETPETEEPVIIAKKRKLYNIGNQHGASGFLFEKVNVIEDFYSYNQHSFEVIKNGQKCIYWAQDVHQLFYENGGIDKVERIGLYEEEMLSDIWLLHKNKKIAVVQQQDLNPKKFVSLTGFEIDNAKIIEDFDLYDGPILELTKGGHVGWFNPLNFDTLVPMEYEEIEKDFDMWDIQSCIKVKKNGLWGLIRINNGKTVIPPLFEWISNDNDYIQVKTASGKYGMFHYQSDRLFVDTIYKNQIGFDEINSMERLENAQEAEINGKSCACILNGGDQQVCYDKIEAILEGERYLVYKNGKVGLVSNYNETLVPVKFDKIEYQKGDDYFIKVFDGDSIFIVEPHGSSVYAGPFHEVSFQKKQKAYVVIQNGKKGVFAEGEVIVPIRFDEIIWTTDYVLVKKDDFWGAYDIYYAELMKPAFKTKEELITALENE